MKKITLYIILFFIALQPVFSQDAKNDKEIHIPLLNEKAPSFTAESTLGKINFPADYFGKWKIIFSHPADFTAVCTTELLELAAMQDDFKKLNAKILVISTDGLQSHLEWIRSMESIQMKDRPAVKIGFPIISDKSLEISRMYGMVHPASSATRDIRGVFIIDPDDRIQSIIYYPMNVGRNLDEIKRLLTALELSESKNVFTPANWNEGDDVLLPSPLTTKEAESLRESNNPDLYSPVWYLWFKKLK